MIKSVKDIDCPEACVSCNSENTRRTIARTQSFSGANDWTTAHYSPALGRVVRSNLEARRLAKERGLVEVGTEPVERIHSHYDKARAEKADKNYRDIVESVTNLGEISA